MRRLLNAIHVLLKPRTLFDSHRFCIPTKATAD